MRISNYPNDTLTGTEMILATNVDAVGEYSTVNFTADALKTFILGPEGGGNQVVFEGTEGDQWETILTTIEPTGPTDNTINLPNVSGTIGVFANASYAVGDELITATPAEVNYLDVTVLGTSEPSKAVTADTSGDIRIEGASNRDIFWDRSEAILTFESGVTMAGAAFTGTTTFDIITATSLDISGDIDIDGTTNLDDVDIDGTLTVAGDILIDKDAGGNITLDTGTGDGYVSFKTADTHYWAIGRDNTDYRFVIANRENGGLGTTGGVFNIEDNTGNATFTGTIDSGAITSTAGIAGTTGTFTGDILIDKPAGGNFTLDSGTGDGYMQFKNADNIRWSIGRDNTDNAFVINYGDGVSSGGQLKLAPTTGDATFTGIITADGGLNLNDNDTIKLGTSQDFEIFHNGTETLFKNTKTESETRFSITDTGDVLRTAILAGGAGGYVKLYGQGVTKLATTATGISVTGGGTFTDNILLDIPTGGSIIIDSGTGDGYVKFKTASTDYWSIGRDNTNNSFVIANGDGLGSSGGVFNIANTTGDATFTGDILVDQNTGGNITIDSGTGDGYVGFKTASTHYWSIGRDNSDNSLVIANEEGLGSAGGILKIPNSTGNITTTRPIRVEGTNVTVDSGGGDGYVGFRTASTHYWSAGRDNTDNSFVIANQEGVGSAGGALKIANSTSDATFSATVKATQFKLSALNTAPSSASDTGTLGEIRIVAGFIYVCTATDTWQRVQIATW